MFLLSWPREKRSHKCLSQAPRTGLNPICCFAKETKKNCLGNLPLFSGCTSGSQVSNGAAGRTNSDKLCCYRCIGAVLAAMPTCRAHQQLSLWPWDTQNTISEPVFVPVSYKAGDPKPACPLAQHGCSPLPTENPSTSPWREPWGCVLITSPSQTLNHPPSTSIGWDGVHCLAMVMPCVFNLWLSSCPSHHRQGGARTLVNCWTVTFIALLKPSELQWKSLWLLSIQIKIKIVNDEN